MKQTDNMMQADDVEVNEDVQEVVIQDDEASSDETPDENPDRFYEYLTQEYRRYRTLSWVLGGIGFSVILIAVGLNINGILPLKIFNLIMSVAYLFILLMAINIFTRSRPYKKRIKQLKGEPSSSIRDDSASDGVKIEENPQFRDMDDVYKILERDIRTEVIPEMPEYKRLRKIWLGVFACALVVAVVSLLLYYFMPESNIFASVLMLVAFALVIIAFYIDRTKMRPMRVEWAKQYGMTEMQMRDNLRDFKTGR